MFLKCRLIRNSALTLLITVTAAAACTSDRRSAGADDSPGNSTLPVYTVDDFGNPLPTDSLLAARIVSLNPTATEIFFALGESKRLIGRSSFDEFPAEAKTIPALGNGIQPNVEAILAARPTLVVLYAADDNRAAARRLNDAGVATLAIRADRIDQFVRLTRILAAVSGSVKSGETVVDSVMATLDAVRNAVASEPVVSVVWPLWNAPVIVAGGGSYLTELLEIAGARNMFGDILSPSPQVSIEEIAARNPDFVLTGDQGVSSFSELPAWQAVAAVREGNIRTVDNQITGRPSVNLGMAAVLLARTLHPEIAGRLP